MNVLRIDDVGKIPRRDEVRGEFFAKLALHKIISRHLADKTGAVGLGAVAVLCEVEETLEERNNEHPFAVARFEALFDGGLYSLVVLRNGGRVADDGMEPQA